MKSSFLILFLALFSASIISNPVNGQHSLDFLKNFNGNIALDDNEGFSVKMGGHYFFTADDGVHGTEIWITDGTVSGTKLLKDIKPGAESGVLYPVSFTGTEYLVYFSLFDEVKNESELWRTDGTNAGTFRITDFEDGLHVKAGNLVLCNGKMFFTTEDPSNSKDLFITDGTIEGTNLINSDKPIEVCSCVGDILYFTITNSMDDLELWRSDGSESGTFRILDNVNGSIFYLPEGGPYYSFQSVALDYNGDFYFAIYPNQLWKTNGTIEGIELVFTFPDGGENIRYPIKKIGNRTYFIRGLSQLWTTDGIEWNLLYDFGCAAINDLKMVSNKTFISVTYGDCSNKTHQKELWETDGTAVGTKFLSIIGDYRNDFPFDTNWTIYEGKLLFEGKDDFHGKEFWISDGTESGTSFFKDILKGSQSSNIGNILEIGSSTYFLADDSDGNRQIWRIYGQSISKATSGDHIIHAFAQINNKLIALVTTEEFGEYDLFSYDLESDIELMLSVFPNPSYDNLIKINSPINFSYQIVNLQGAVVVKGKKEEETVMINFGDIKPGIYELVIYTKTGITSRKLVVH